MKPIYACFAILFAAILTWSAPASARDLPAVAAKARCEDLAAMVFAIEGSAARVTAATTAPALPMARPSKEIERVPTCHVTGYVAPQIQFDLRLPLQDWHQRFIFLGCGGFCGGMETRTWAAWGCTPLDRGEFAVVTSDLGHKAGRSDGVWAVGNPQGLRDFGSRGVHVVTLAARKIITAFYGQAARFGYFNGCSDGGREALMAAQRYPGDFDGIVAGAPALNLTANNSIYHAWMAQHLLAPDGKPLFTDAQFAALHDEVLAQCDAVDGKSDGILADPRSCHPSFERIRCGASATPTCVTAEQIARVQAVYAGPTAPGGRPLYHGAPVGSEKYWNQAPGSVQFAMNFISFMTGAPDPVPVDVWQLDYTAASQRRYDRPARELNATDTNLGPFAAIGGKMLVWHGWADSSIPPTSTTDYVAGVRRRLGNAKTDAFLRLYMVPGMAHCTGGDGPFRVDFLDPLMRWGEDGIAPDQVNANMADEAKPAWSLQPLRR